MFIPLGGLHVACEITCLLVGPVAHVALPFSLCHVTWRDGTGCGDQIHHSSVENADFAVVAGGKDKALIAIPARLGDCAIMLECEALLTGDRIPHSGGAIVAGGEDKALVSVPARLGDIVIMLKDEALLTGDRVPTLGRCRHCWR